MNKVILFMFSIYLFSACGSCKITSEEKCLLLNSTNDKIYIFSCFPKTDKSEGIYFSSILVAHAESSKHQVSAFVNSFDVLKRTRTAHFLFNDSISTFNTNTLPLLIHQERKDSLSTNFIFSLNRKSTILENEKVSFKISHNSKQHFQIDSIGGDLEINKVVLNESTLDNLTTTEYNQASNYTIHTLDNPTILFESSNYYWLDFQLNDTIHSLLFQEIQGDSLKTLYSSLPSDKVNNYTVLKNPISDKLIDEKWLIRMDDDSKQPIYFSLPYSIPTNNGKNTFQVYPIQLIQNNEFIGNGIIYMLENKDE